MDKSSLSEADIEALIKLVADRPSIWDKSCNRDSAEKKKAWREIFEHFSRQRWGIDWDDLNEADQKKCGNFSRFYYYYYELLLFMHACSRNVLQ